MTRFGFTALGVGAAALGLAACTPPHPHHHTEAALKTIAALDCPATQGDLTRKSAAADGKSCLYGDDQGGEVTLQLIDLAGQDPAAALAPLETQLKAEMPAVAAKPGAGVSADNDRVDIDLPGIHIHANGNKDATVQVAGGRIVGKTDTTPDKNGGSPVSTGKPGVSIVAADSGAEVRVNEPGGGVRRSFILASDDPGPNGYKTVGYEARGPVGGPLVVASAKAKSDDDLKDDMRDLLRLNVGG